MGKSEKPGATTEKEAPRRNMSALAGVGGLVGTDTASVSSAGSSLHAAAALESLLKNAQQGMSSAPISAEAQAQLLLSSGLDPLQAIARNPSLLARVAKNVLPRSAPVSSLLPPLPQEGLTPQAILALQSQLAALGGSSVASLLGGGSSGNMPSSLHGGTDLAALQQLLATQTVAAPKANLPSSIASSITPDMQNWPLEKLGKSIRLLVKKCGLSLDKGLSLISLLHLIEQHVNFLNQLKQPVPESLAVLLADARRKEAKKTAKRLANRKSASSSRARKKALVQEMTELNARLKRQAQILSLLPDLVITINVDGVITFCSAQVERVLHHNVDDIVGSQLADLLVPASRDRLNRLVLQLVASEQMAALGVTEADLRSATKKSGSGMEHPVGSASNVDSALAHGGDSSEIAVVSEPSFPLSVVKVKAKEGMPDENDNSDNSASLSASKGTSSLTQDSIGNSGADETKNGEQNKSGKKLLPSSDISNSSTLSTTAKKLQNANHNLEKNVRAHNKKMKKKGCPSYRDDVTGADVTANNASARLSSLKHCAESSSEEDSGYRESNDSREETSSSASDSSSSNRTCDGSSLPYGILVSSRFANSVSFLSGRRKPLAPTCTICLVRKDNTTIWCEVTSSIRTVEVPKDFVGFEESDDGKSRKSSSKVGAKSEEGSTPSEPESPPEKELLLCLRPIRDGEDKVGYGIRKKKKSTPPSSQQLESSSPERSESAKPPKKRRLDPSLAEEPPSKKAAPSQKDEPVNSEPV